MKVSVAPLLLAAAVASLSGCAVPTTGIVPLSDGMAKVRHQGNGAWVQTETLKAEATQEASAYCSTKSRAIRVIDVKQTAARPFGGWPEAEVLFKCE